MALTKQVDTTELRKKHERPRPLVRQVVVQAPPEEPKRPLWPWALLAAGGVGAFFWWRKKKRA